ncbi:hypothetical protein DESC_720262 [Desulfosarcina cetonica]|nr:hypothetical protein DESC_720262 [Desulfosarcina cetonica]
MGKAQIGTIKGLTPRNHAFLLTKADINSIPAPCIFTEENRVIATIPLKYSEKIREEVTLIPLSGGRLVSIGRSV